MEASMVMPVVILLIGMVFYLTFYLYNRCVVAQDTYLLAFRGSLCCGTDNAAVERYLAEESRKQYGEKYIATGNWNSNADVTGKTVTVAARGKLLPTGWYFGAEWQAQRICPTDCIRKVRLAVRMKEGITAWIKCGEMENPEKEEIK